MKPGVVNIKGKEYQTVALRVQTFREKHPNYRLLTEIEYRDGECVVMSARIADESGNVVATGHAEEYRNASQINATSALENAETSAIGRALAALGLGGTEFASADEVARAVSGQKPAYQSVAQDVWDKMPPDVQARLDGVAQLVIQELESHGGLKAMELLSSEVTDVDEKVAIWSRFNSKERAAMEPHKRTKRAA